MARPKWLRLRAFRKRTAASRPDGPPLSVRLPDAEPWLLALVEEVKEMTMTSPERILALAHAVQYVVQQQIAGDFVECGVWRGGSMRVVIRVLQRLAAANRTLWLYDTFEGMTPPTQDDVDFMGHQARTLLETTDPQDSWSVWCRSPLEQVQHNLQQTGYPPELLRWKVGPVEETLQADKPDHIALLRLDTDWYESTRAELENLFPRLAPGGVLIVDDYGHWSGCRKAVDEYFAAHGVRMMLHRIDYTGRIGVYWPQMVEPRGAECSARRNAA